MIFRISISQAGNSPIHGAHTNFNTMTFGSMGELASRVCYGRWSPIIWKDGKRDSRNFLQSDFLVLDFDSGIWGPQEALKFCQAQGYKYVLGPSQNHMRPKEGAAPCARFRLILPWEMPIKDFSTYTQNMQRIVKNLPADRQATDGARMYKPCTNFTPDGFRIIWNEEGRGVKWFPFRPNPPRRRSQYHELKILPGWLRRMLEHTPPVGSRNEHTFKLAAKLAEHGYSKDEVIEAIMQAPIDLTEKQKRTAAESGYDRRRS